MANIFNNKFKEKIETLKAKIEHNNVDPLEVYKKVIKPPELKIEFKALNVNQIKKIITSIVQARIEYNNKL